MQRGGCLGPTRCSSASSARSARGGSLQVRRAVSRQSRRHALATPPVKARTGRIRRVVMLGCQACPEVVPALGRQRQARAPQGSEGTPQAQSFAIRLQPAAATFGAKAKPRPLGLLADHSAVSSAEQTRFTWQLLGFWGAWMAQGVAQSCCGCKKGLAERRSAGTERAAREALPCRQGSLKQAWRHTT